MATMTTDMQRELKEAGVVFEMRPNRNTGKNEHIAFLDGHELDRSKYLGELIKSLYASFGG